MRKSKTSVTLESEESQRTSRRRFNKTVAATAIFAATPFANAAARAQTVTPGTTKETPAPPKPQTTPATTATAGAAAAAQKPSPLAEAYAEVARVRFGGQITPEQLAQIKKDVAGMVRTADRLRAVKLQNADEPDFVFNA
jgi:hypothetical protein